MFSNEWLVFFWPGLSAGFAAGTLSLFGCQLMARNQTLHILVLSQWIQCLHLGLYPLVLILGWNLGAQLFALSAAIITITLPISFIFFYWLRRKGRHLGNHDLLMLYVILLSLAYFLIRLLPGLEAHNTQYFWGDLAFASTSESLVSLIFALVGAPFIIFFKSSLTRFAFDTRILEKNASPKDTSLELVFYGILIVFSTLCIQTFGLLFTLGMLIIPSALFQRLHIIYSMQGLLIGCFAVSILASWTGFLLSLKFSSLATTPTVIFTLISFILILKPFLTRNKTHHAEN